MVKIKKFIKRVKFWWLYVVQCDGGYFDCHGFCPACKWYDNCYTSVGPRV